MKISWLWSWSAEVNIWHILVRARFGLLLSLSLSYHLFLTLSPSLSPSKQVCLPFLLLCIIRCPSLEGFRLSLREENQNALSYLAGTVAGMGATSILIRVQRGSLLCYNIVDPFFFIFIYSFYFCLLSLCLSLSSIYSFLFLSNCHIRAEGKSISKSTLG